VAHRNCAPGDAHCEKTTPKTETADNLTFIDNALRWAMRPTPVDCPTKTITIAIYEGWEKMPETQEIADLAKRREWSYKRLLPTADPTIWGNPWGDDGDLTDPVLAPS
jgi:hypothetical protein